MDSSAGPNALQEAIDAVGFGRFQRRLLLICGAAWAADAAEVLLLGFALPQITDELGLSSAQASLSVTATFLGMLVGAWVAGPIGDRVGRRTTFQAAVIVSSVFGGLTALSPDGWWLAGLRTVTGFGLGAALPLNFSLFAEYLPSHNRGRNLVLLEAFWAVGTVLAAGLAWLLIPTLGWRALVASTAATVVVVYWIRRDVPESPRYLLTAGRADEARAAVAHVAAFNHRTTPLLDGIVAASGPWEPGGTVQALWRPDLRRTTIVLWATWLCIAFGYYGMFTWLPSVFVERGYDFLQTYQFTFILALAQVPGYLSAAYLVERWGRRPTLATYFLGSGLFTVAFATATTTTTIVATASVMSFFALGAWGALYAYTPEAYPTQIRATGVGWASGMTRIAGAAAPVVGGILLPIALEAALISYAVAFLGGAVIVAAWAAETRGRPLRDALNPSGPGFDRPNPPERP